jgi:glycosyltransferase involved in cell wall biosynthesis
MDAPLVSVLMPVRNAEATLEAALESVTAQTLGRWELVAIDDGSTDRSLEILSGAAARDPRIRLVARPPRGIVASLNEGLQLARAGLVARLDADDLCLPERLERQVAHAARHPDQVVIGCHVACFPRERVRPGMAHYEAWLNGLVEPLDIAREIFVESPLAHPSALMRREPVLALGGYRDGPFPEDYDLWLRVHASGHAIGKVPEVLVLWREGEGRLTRTDPRYSPLAFQRLKAEHLARGFLLGQARVQIWGAGRDGKTWRPALLAHGLEVARFYDVDPRKIGGRVGREVPVLAFSEIPRHRDEKLLCAVGVKGARAEMRAALVQMSLVEGADYLFVQ